MSKKRVVLTFPPTISGEPLTYRLIKDYDLRINILRASINPRKEGKLVLEIENGSDQAIEAGLDFLRSRGVTVEALAREITWDKQECVNCGACTAVCTTAALRLQDDGTLAFDDSRCTACEMCVQACPLRILRVAV